MIKIEELSAFLNILSLEINLNQVWLFIILSSISMAKSTVFISSFLPPASIMLLTSITTILPKLNIILIWLAITLGSSTGSMISYHIGNQITNKKLFNRFLNNYQSMVDYIYIRLQKQEIIVLFTSRFIAILRYITPLVAGILSMNQIKVYTICLLSASVWATIFILIAKGMFNIIEPMIY